MKIRINKQEYDVRVAETQAEKEQGLKDVYYLPEDEGMIFMYEEEGPHTFCMHGTFIPLDIIGIDSEFQVTSIIHAQPIEECYEEFVAKYVLELPNPQDNVTLGDEVDFLDDEMEDSPSSKMLVLNEEGEVQMELDGGERIFSRKDTRVLVKLAARAYRTGGAPDYKKLGQKLFQCLDKQSTNETEYVTLKDKEPENETIE